MAGQSPLRRWKPFFAAFGLVDAAIEAAGPSLCRDKYRSARGEVVELLCGVPARDAGKAEDLCLLLDGIMAESLLTLQAVPAEAVRRMLASSAELAKAVGALRSHQSERVRGLARDVVRGWNVAVKEDIAEASAAMKELDDASRAKVPRRTPPPDGRAVMRDGAERKMEDTKRKLREGYREAEDAKRQRKIQVIQAPRIAEERQRRIHPILRERSRARCGRSTDVRRCLVSSFKN